MSNRRLLNVASVKGTGICVRATTRADSFAYIYWREQQPSEAVTKRMRSSTMRPTGWGKIFIFLDDVSIRLGAIA